MPCSAVANIVTGDGGKSLYYDWHSQASNFLSLDCRRYCSLVKTWRHVSQGWTLHRIKAGRQQTNCLWQRMPYCLLDLMDRQFLPRYLWMMRLGIPHCDTTCTFSCFKVQGTRQPAVISALTRPFSCPALEIPPTLPLSHTHAHTHVRTRVLSPFATPSRGPRMR